MEPAALIRQRLRRNWRRVRSCLVQSRLRRKLFPPPFALISFGNLDAGKSSLSTHHPNHSSSRFARDDNYFFSQRLFSRASRAASTSAPCLLRPVPRPRTSPSQRASTTKVLACSGPVAESTS